MSINLNSDGFLMIRGGRLIDILSVVVIQRNDILYKTIY